MTVTPIREGDYESLLTPWWESWGWTPPPQDYLPNTGFILYDNDVPVCAAYLYMTNSKVAWIEWLVSNKNYRKKPGRREGILFLLSYMIEIAKQSGYSYITAIAENRHAIEIYETIGFVSDKGKSQTLILCQ